MKVFKTFHSCVDVQWKNWNIAIRGLETVLKDQATVLKLPKLSIQPFQAETCVHILVLLSVCDLQDLNRAAISATKLP
jgi:hypothetical protein